MPCAGHGVLVLLRKSTGTLPFRCTVARRTVARRAVTIDLIVFIVRRHHRHHRHRILSHVAPFVIVVVIVAPSSSSPSLSLPVAIVVIVISCRAAAYLAVAVAIVGIVVVARRAVAIIVDFVARRKEPHHGTDSRDVILVIRRLAPGGRGDGVVTPRSQSPSSPASGKPHCISPGPTGPKTQTTSSWWWSRSPLKWCGFDESIPPKRWAAFLIFFQCHCQSNLIDSIN